MLLAPDDAALFYRAWGSILVWVNEQRHVVPPFPAPTPGHPIEPPITNQLRKVLWADDGLRERFLADGAGGLSDAERDLIASWRHRVTDDFTLLRHLKRHSIFMSKAAYAVLGIYTPLEVMLPHVPMYVTATLLPFGERIITDGNIESPSIHISFGGGARRMFREEYSAVLSRGQLVKSLPPPATNVVALAAAATGRRSRGGR
ncbi:MAG: hypothetical protein IT384_24690 [Deltaproteobacteria bacterium]|nr:hypothetical protein [Deltaproteobacteria bacterium]